VVSATDLTFLWDDCPRCFYRKVVLGEPKPRSPFPAVFGRIDRAMKTSLVGRRAEEVVPGAPPGVITGADRWVRSAPMSVPGRPGQLVIRGRIDALVVGDDGVVTVVDFKTTDAKECRLPAYSRQLHAYATALEHPGSGRSVTVSALGLLCFAPEAFWVGEGPAELWGKMRWVLLAREDKAFAKVLGEALSLVEQSEAPEPAASCRWCQLLADHRVA
jgi:hypothetical protein